LDSNNNGVIITALYSRGAANLYSKELIRGESKQTLSDEELTVLNKALGKN